MFKCCGKKKNNGPIVDQWAPSTLDTVETLSDSPIIDGIKRRIRSPRPNNRFRTPSVGTSQMPAPNTATSPLKIVYNMDDQTPNLSGFSDSDFSEYNPLLNDNL